MAGKRKIYWGAFKAQVALAAHKGDRTVNDVAGHYGVLPTLIHAWKKQLTTRAVGILEGPPSGALRTDRAAQDGTRVAQKKSCPLRLRTEGCWSRSTTPS